MEVLMGSVSQQHALVFSTQLEYHASYFVMALAMNNGNVALRFDMLLYYRALQALAFPAAVHTLLRHAHAIFPAL